MTHKDININWPLVGNGHIADFLLKCLKKGDVSGPYIFCGPDNLGKTAVALFFAQVLLCQSGKSELPCGECYSCKKFSAPKISKKTSPVVIDTVREDVAEVEKKKKTPTTISIPEKAKKATKSKGFMKRMFRRKAI